MHEHKSLSNGWLTVTVLVILLIFLSVVYRAMQKSRPQSAWQTAQKQNLAEDLSGQTNAKSEELKRGDIKGKFIHLPILMYHHIGEVPEESQNDEVRKGLTVSLEDFEDQVIWVKSQGYTSVSLQNLLDFSQGKVALPKNPIIFTFDDGYEDALINATAILKKYGMTGSFAIITQFPGIHYGTNKYATWQQIKTAKAAGMEIVSHTQDHFDGTSLAYDDKFIVRNLTNSRQDLKDNAGTETKILIYPFGHYDARYIKLAQQAGFTLGVTTHEGKIINLDGLMEVPRLRIGGSTTLPGFKKLLSGKP